MQTDSHTTHFSGLVTRISAEPKQAARGGYLFRGIELAGSGAGRKIFLIFPEFAGEALFEFPLLCWEGAMISAYGLDFNNELQDGSLIFTANQQSDVLIEPYRAVSVTEAVHAARCIKAADLVYRIPSNEPFWMEKGKLIHSLFVALLHNGGQITGRPASATNNRIGLGLPRTPIRGRSASAAMAGSDGSTQIRTAGDHCGIAATDSGGDAGSHDESSLLETNSDHSSTAQVFLDGYRRSFPRLMSSLPGSKISVDDRALEEEARRHFEFLALWLQDNRRPDEHAEIEVDRISTRWGLKGRADCIFEGPGARFVVELKTGRTPISDHLFQLFAYTMLFGKGDDCAAIDGSLLYSGIGLETTLDELRGIHKGAILRGRNRAVFLKHAYGLEGSWLDRAELNEPCPRTAKCVHRDLCMHLYGNIEWLKRVRLSGDRKVYYDHWFRLLGVEEWVQDSAFCRVLDPGTLGERVADGTTLPVGGVRLKPPCVPSSDIGSRKVTAYAAEPQVCDQLIHQEFSEGGPKDNRFAKGVPPEILPFGKGVGFRSEDDRESPAQGHYRTSDRTGIELELLFEELTPDVSPGEEVIVHQGDACAEGALRGRVVASGPGKVLVRARRPLGSPGNGPGGEPSDAEVIGNSRFDPAMGMSSSAESTGKAPHASAESEDVRGCTTPDEEDGKDNSRRSAGLEAAADVQGSRLTAEAEGSRDFLPRTAARVDDSSDSGTATLQDSATHPGSSSQNTSARRANSSERHSSPPGSGSQDLPTHPGGSSLDSPTQSGSSLQNTPLSAGASLQDSPTHAGASLQDSPTHAGDSPHNSPPLVGGVRGGGKHQWYLDKIPFSRGPQNGRHALFRFLDRGSPSAIDAVINGTPEDSPVAKGPDSNSGSTCEPPAPDEDLDFAEGLFGELNEDQQAAVMEALNSDVYHLIHGPPGTGKTRVLARLAKMCLDRGERLLIACPTNVALDRLLISLMDLGVLNFIRVGGRSVVSGEFLEALERHGRPAVLLDDLTSSGIDCGAFRKMVRHTGLIGATAFQTVAHPMFCRQEFDRVIVDEAGQLDEPSALGPLALGKRFVLGGDHLQLPPVVQARSEDPAQPFGLECSLFERLFESGPSSRISALRVQYRMNQEVQDIPSRLFYGGSLVPSAEAAQRRLNLNVGLAPTSEMERILDPSSPVVFVDVPGPDSGKARPEEAHMAAAIVEGLLLCGVPAEQVGIITPYKAQQSLIRAGMPESAGKISVDTVDRFQGGEREVIILSLARSDSVTSFLADRKRLNVSLSRARSKLVLLGHGPVLEGHSLFSAILDGVKRVPVKADSFGSD